MAGLIAALVTVAGQTSTAQAGDYHFQATLVCADCHNDQVAGATTLVGGWSADQLCLSCHDGKPGVPDVRAEDVNAIGGPRAAGALTAGGGGHEDWKGHTLGAQQSPPGGSWPGGETRLRCVSCHSPHGNTSYRNLGGVVSNPPLITYTTSPAPNNTTDVRIDLAGVPAVGARVAAGFYSTSRIYYNEVSPLGSPYGAFCAGCHGEFHGRPKTGLMSPFRRHPTEGVGMPAAYVARYNSHTNRVPLMIANNGAKTVATTSASTSCMTCHRAHGSRNAFGLIFMKAAGPVTEQGVDGGRLTDLCAQCHSEGS